MRHAYGELHGLGNTVVTVSAESGGLLLVSLQRKWHPASRSYGNNGNTNQWNVNAGLASLAPESAQKLESCATAGQHGELVDEPIRLTGESKASVRVCPDRGDGLLVKGSPGFGAGNN